VIEALKAFDSVTDAIFASGANSKTNDCSKEVISEQNVMNEFGKQLRHVTGLRDTYVTECYAICEQLCKQLRSLKSLQGKQGRIWHKNERHHRFTL
jgi:hypothetical protein